MRVTHQNILRRAAERPLLPQRAQLAPLNRPLQVILPVLVRAEIAIFRQAFVKPSRHYGISPPGSVRHQQMDKLVGSSTGHPLPAAIDQQHPLLGKRHPRRYQLLPGGLGAERQRAHHIPVVVISNDVQRFLRVNAQHRPHSVQGSRRRFQHVLRPALRQRVVVINRNQPVSQGKPPETGIQIDKDLLLSAEQAAGGIPNLKGISHPGAGRKVVAAAAEQLGFAADPGSRLKLHLPVRAAADLPDGFQKDPDVVDFVRPGRLDKEVDAFRKAAFDPVGQEPDFSILLGLGRRGGHLE